MKYNYKVIIKYDIKDLAAKFIKEQFKSTDFKKLNSDEVLSIVSKKAWNDSMSYVGRFVIKDPSIKKEMYDRAFETIKKYVDGESITEDYAIEGIPDMKIPSDFSLGVWQKYSSMVFKYLYSIQWMEIKDQFKWFELSEYNKCKCPIDRLIARSVFSMLPFDKKEERALAWFLSGNNTGGDMYRNISWSKITKDEYIMFQNSVNEICNSFDKKIIPLQYDLIFWEPANILDKQGMEQYRVC